MARVFRFVFPALLLVTTLSYAQDTPKERKPMGGGSSSNSNTPPAPTTDVPPEEDAAFATKNYEFNPLQATKEINTGRFYMHKGNWKGARNRFLEATRWNPGSAEAFLLLGEAEEKLNNRKNAKEAYQKYLEIEPESKEAGTIKKKLAKL